MIIITVYGLDQFVVGNYSRGHTKKLAELFECKSEDLIFYAPNSYIFQNGVEQTSWQVIVKIRCDHKYEALSKNIANYISKTICEFGIHVYVEFEYVHGQAFDFINKEYPRFLKEDNMVKVETPNTDGIDITDEEQVYTGDVFKDLKKLKK